MLSNISKTEMQMPYDLIYLWNLKTKELKEIRFVVRDLMGGMGV